MKQWQLLQQQQWRQQRWHHLNFRFVSLPKFRLRITISTLVRPENRQLRLSIIQLQPLRKARAANPKEGAGEPLYFPPETIPRPIKHG